jgi:hypothetical protein
VGDGVRGAGVGIGGGSGGGAAVVSAPAWGCSGTRHAAAAAAAQDAAAARAVFEPPPARRTERTVATARPRSAEPWQRGSPFRIALPVGPPPWQPSRPATACGGGSHAGATPPFHEVCSSWEGGQGNSQGSGSGGGSPRTAQVRPSSARPARPSPVHPGSPRQSTAHQFPASARPNSARPVGGSPASGIEFNKLSRVDRRAHVLGLIYKHQEQQRGRQTFF